MTHYNKKLTHPATYDSIGLYNKILMHTNVLYQANLNENDKTYTMK